MIDKKLVVLFSHLLLYAPIVSAHEYWLAPITYTVETGQQIDVDIRNGDNFAGSAFPYLPESYEEITFVGAGEQQAIASRIGDMPAIHPVAEQEGLYSVLLASTERTLTYEGWEKFNTFLSYHGLNSFVEKHRALRFPTTNIKEHYYRFAKTFVQVSDSGEHSTLSTKDKDVLSKAYGQELEIRIHNNPYADDRVIELELLYQGVPLENRQIELFSKAGSVKRVVTKTDTQGRARFNDVVPGEHMLNAVHMVSATRRGAHWKTLWASVTLSTVK